METKTHTCDHRSVALSAEKQLLASLHFFFRTDISKPKYKAFQSNANKDSHFPHAYSSAPRESTSARLN